MFGPNHVGELVESRYKNGPFNQLVMRLSHAQSFRLVRSRDERALIPQVSRVLVAFCALLLLAASDTKSVATPHSQVRPDSNDAQNVRDTMLSKIPPDLAAKWRKYGQWDYKEQAFKYHDFTMYNFGAKGAAAGLDQSSLLALVRAFKPNPEDVKDLADPRLQIIFGQNTKDFEKLRSMAQQDVHVIRIASDFTWLDSNNKWPRSEVGFSDARWDEYRKLFKELFLTEGIFRTEDYPGAIFFIARSDGLCTGGSSAGYVYSTTELSPVEESPTTALDAEARKHPEKHIAFAFQKLENDWYTFYEVDW